MKGLLLIGALMLNPIAINEEIEPETEIVVEEPQAEEEPKEEVVEKKEEEKEEPKEEVVEEEPKENELTDEEIEQISKGLEIATETIEYLKSVLLTLGIGGGSISLGAILSLVIVALRSFANSLKLKKSKNETLANVKEAILKEVDTSVDTQIQEQIKPVLNDVLKALDNSRELQGVISKIIALSQENSPASRLAILDCIASIGVVNKEVIEEAKESIKEEVASEEKKIEEAKESLDNIITETETKEVKEDNSVEEYLKGL